MAYFANATREPVTVRIQALQAQMDCTHVNRRSRELLASRDLFEPQATYTLQAGSALPLELDSRSCGAVIVQILGFSDQLVFWSDRLYAHTTETEFAPLAKPGFREQALILEGDGEDRVLANGALLEVTALPPASPSDLVAVPMAISFGWSGEPPPGLVSVERKETLADGCLSVGLLGAGGSSKLFLCVPTWGFPYEVGDSLRFTLFQPEIYEYDGYNYRVTRSAYRKLLMQGATEADPKVELWVNHSTLDQQFLSKFTPIDQPASRTRCGAQTIPLAVEVLPLKRELLAGQEVQVSNAGLTTHFMLGRAEQVVVAPRACPGGYSSAGAHVDLLVVKTWEKAL
ncbi:MAG: hypothetical protein SFV15_24620 [Polyangiaceae bacterium]|nr:hypothetical protein [Polyangiaceae bacterium]